MRSSSFLITLALTSSFVLAAPAPVGDEFDAAVMAFDAAVIALEERPQSEYPPSSLLYGMIPLVSLPSLPPATPPSSSAQSENDIEISSTAFAAPAAAVDFLTDTTSQADSRKRKYAYTDEADAEVSDAKSGKTSSSLISAGATDDFVDPYNFDYDPEAAEAHWQSLSWIPESERADSHDEFSIATSLAKLDQERHLNDVRKAALEEENRVMSAKAEHAAIARKTAEEDRVERVKAEKADMASEAVEESRIERVRIEEAEITRYAAEEEERHRTMAQVEMMKYFQEQELASRTQTGPTQVQRESKVMQKPQGVVRTPKEDHDEYRRIMDIMKASRSNIIINERPQADLSRASRRGKKGGLSKWFSQS